MVDLKQPGPLYMNYMYSVTLCPRLHLCRWSSQSESGASPGKGGHARFKTWKKGFDHRVTPPYILESTSGTVMSP